MRDLLVIVAWFLSMVASARAEANASEPIFAPPAASSAGGEVRGLAQIEIVVETLVFDLRPLDDGEPPTVRASYELDNHGPSLTTPLVFASYDMRGGEVTFDGETIAVTQHASDGLPPYWTTPEGTIAASTYGDPDASGLAFALTIPPGRHTLTVSYTLGGDWRTWHPTGSEIRYALQPARSWKALRALEVEVRTGASAIGPSLAPPVEDDDSRRGRDPELVQREPGRFVAHYDGVPRDTLTLRFERPIPWWLHALGIAVRVLGLVVLAVFLKLASGIVARVDRTSLRVLALMSGVAAAVGGSWSCSAGIHAVNVWQTGQHGGGYHGMMTYFGVGMLTFVVAAIGLPVLVGRRRRPPGSG